ncbi:hypothetical protein AVEN_247917-1 [Araneus ventricosus]|uniref:Uncharacterized protein n=1 Tax=Araneus ventricosus TaxID=182803 RepID=A0A4Y2CJC8_ARAVE|nr:hypothetical protein AVEN_247917-1 [Araneus ventricosus]
MELNDSCGHFCVIPFKEKFDRYTPFRELNVVWLPEFSEHGDECCASDVTLMQVLYCRARRSSRWKIAAGSSSISGVQIQPSQLLQWMSNVGRGAILFEDDVLKALPLFDFWDYKIPQYFMIQ